MNTNMRDFQRQFGRMRRAASTGKEIRIRDLETGEEFIFKAAPAAKRTFWEVAGHLAGVATGGPGDLSTNKKHMEDFGRDKGDRRYRVVGGIPRPE